MNYSYKNSSVIRFLSYLLFAVLGVSGGISIYQGETLWALSFLSAFLTAAIYFVAVTDNSPYEDKSDDG